MENFRVILIKTISSYITILTRLLEKTSYALYEVICINGILNIIQNIIKFNTNVW